MQNNENRLLASLLTTAAGTSTALPAPRAINISAHVNYSPPKRLCPAQGAFCPQPPPMASRGVPPFPCAYPQGAYCRLLSEKNAMLLMFAARGHGEGVVCGCSAHASKPQLRPTNVRGGAEQIPRQRAIFDLLGHILRCY